LFEFTDSETGLS
jgi:hypothetical protein